MEEEGREKDNDGEKREIGKLAVWSVSSFKPGNGVDLLRDSNIETYWQSDGAQPHLVNIQFQKKVRLQQLALYVDFKLDESYTPNKISVRAGNSFHDLREIKVVELAEPIGWVYISLCPSDSSKLLCYRIIKMEGTPTFVKSQSTGLVTSGDRNREAVVWSQHSGPWQVKVKNMLYHTARITTLAWSLDSLKVATGSVDTSVYVYDVTQAASARTVIKNSHLGGVTSVAFVNATTLVTGCDDCCLRAWNL